MTYTLIIPIYKNEHSLPELLSQISTLKENFVGDFNVAFIIDGSPDKSFLYLSEHLKNVNFDSRLILLSRNFGSFSAIRAGLELVESDYYAVIAADLQEPIDLIPAFFNQLKDNPIDIVFGTRSQRDDPFLSKIFSTLFWYLYKKFVQPDIPDGGVDLFGCNRYVRDQIMKLKESNTTLIGLLFWIGFRRSFIPYVRSRRPYGKSAWSFRKKAKYLLDSLFAFSDLPIRMLTLIGGSGLIISFILFFIVLYNKLTGNIAIPGYSATIAVVLFFGALNSFGLGIIGEYLWRAFENTKSRPLYLVSTDSKYLKR